MRFLRVAVCAGLTSILMLVDAVASIASAGGSLGGEGFTGPGIGAMISTLLALALADGAAAQWGSEEGAARSRIFRVGLSGIVWCCIRLGMGDPYVVPAIAGFAWCTSAAWLFEAPEVTRIGSDR